MSDLLKILFVDATLALPGASFAQTNTTDDTTTEAEAETAEERDDGLSTGQEVDPADAVGATRVVSVHVDWELRCIKAPEGQKDPCQLYQLLEDQNGNSVAEINLFNLEGDDKLAGGATIVTPLETLLTRSVTLSVDGGKAKVYPFTFCTKIGCFARVGFTPGDIAAFKNGATAKIVVVPAQAPDQKVELTMSLAGFTAAFDAVTAATAE